MTLLSIEGAMDPATNPFSAKTLTKDLEALVGASLATQAQALVMMRQADAAPFTRNEALASTLRTHQQDMRQSAEYFLNGMMPDVIKAVTNADGASTLMTAFNTSVVQSTAQGEAQRTEVAQMIEAIGECVAGHAQDAGVLADAFGREADRFEDVRQDFAAILEARIRKLEGPDGAISKTRAKIATTRQAIEADIQDIVDASTNIGNGLKKIVTGVLTTFDMAAGGGGKSSSVSTDDAGDGEESVAPKKIAADDKTVSKKAAAAEKDTAAKPAAADKDAAKTGSDKAAPAKADKDSKTDKDTKDSKSDQISFDKAEEAGDKAFPVEGVGAVTSGAEGVETSVANFQADNAALAALYQHLGRQNALLAIASVVHDQIADYAKALRVTSTMAARTQETWSQIQAGLDGAFADLRAGGDPAETVRAVGVLTKAALNTSWSRLSDRTRRIRDAISGQSGLIPSVPSLAA